MASPVDHLTRLTKRKIVGPLLKQFLDICPNYGDATPEKNFYTYILKPENEFGHLDVEFNFYNTGWRVKFNTSTGFQDKNIGYIPKLENKTFTSSKELSKFLEDVKRMRYKDGDKNLHISSFYDLMYTFLTSVDVLQIESEKTAGSDVTNISIKFDMKDSNHGLVKDLLENIKKIKQVEK